MLQDKAMLFGIKLRTYNPHKRDREMSNIVAQAYQADKDYISTTKRLVPKSAYDAIQKIDTKIRAHVYDNTRPWLDDGIRVLPMSIYFEFCDELSNLLGQREQLVNEFCEQWPTTRQEVINALGGSYRDGDIPDNITDRFGVDKVFMPIPRAGDFRAEGLDPEDIAKIESETLQRIEEQFNSKDLWERIRRTLTTQSGPVGQRLRDYGTDDEGKVVNKFHDTLINNIKDLVKVLPKLNITNDPDVDEIAQQLKAEVCAYDPEVLRVDDQLRMSVADKADEILKRVSAFMG
jgi:hypothetical protein